MDRPGGADEGEHERAPVLVRGGDEVRDAVGLPLLLLPQLAVHLVFAARRELAILDHVANEAGHRVDVAGHHLRGGRVGEEREGGRDTAERGKKREEKRRKDRRLQIS